MALEINGVKTADIYPRPSELPDLFAGSQLLIAGRYVGDGPVTARLTGSVNGRPVSYALSTDPARRRRRRRFPAAALGDAQDRLSAGRHPPAPDRGGVGETTTRNWWTKSCACPKSTASSPPTHRFLVTDGNENTPMAMNRCQSGPTAGDSRTDEEHAAASGAAAPAPDPGRLVSPHLSGRWACFALPSGAAATTQSLNLHAAQKSACAKNSVGFDDAVAAQDVQERVRTFGARTFFLQNGVWTDSAYDPAKKQPVTAVQAFSPAHFALLKALPDLAACSSLGDKVADRPRQRPRPAPCPAGGRDDAGRRRLKALTGGVKSLGAT